MTAPSERFAWLREKSARRSSLIEVASALRRGEIDADGRDDLRRELDTLRESGGLNPRESARVAQILRMLASRRYGDRESGPDDGSE